MFQIQGVRFRDVTIFDTHLAELFIHYFSESLSLSFTRT